jgi:hypothetical protein
MKRYFGLVYCNSQKGSKLNISQDQSNCSSLFLHPSKAINRMEWRKGLLIPVHPYIYNINYLKLNYFNKKPYHNQDLALHTISTSFTQIICTCVVFL